MQKIWNSEQFAEVIVEHSYTDVDTFLAAIGEHHVSARSVAQRVSRLFRTGDLPEQLPTTVFEPRRQHADGTGTTGVHVEGLDDLMVRLANCCTPVPGDEIIGYVTRGRGVSVHRHDCTNAMTLANDEAARMIEVEWDGDRREEMYTAGVEVVALDRSRLLRDVANAVGEQGVNIIRCDTIVGNDRVAKMRFEFEMSSAAQLGSVLNTIKRIDAVYDVHRIVPGHG